mgnify:CR=1 FL=1
MKIFYKNGFYFEGIHYNIPENAVEITEQYYNELLNDASNGRSIIADSNGFPISTITLESWKEDKYKEIEKEFKFIVSECPVQYTNKHYYLPEYVNDYVKLLPKYFDDKPMKIWDASGKEKNVVEFTKEELIDLIKFLSEIYETAYQNKKIKESKLESLNKIDDSF